MMREECLSPDAYTFSALAKGCQNRHDAEQLLTEMKVDFLSTSFISSTNINIHRISI